MGWGGQSGCGGPEGRQGPCVPALPSDTRSGVQPDSPLRLYCHRHRGAETWDLLPGGRVSAARKRGGPPCGHRGSNRSGPEPAPWRSLSVLCQTRMASLSDPCFCTELVSHFRSPLPAPPKSPLSPCFFGFLCLSLNTPLFLPSGFHPSPLSPIGYFLPALTLLLDLDTFYS